ncbi:hypothetical protein VCR20J5_280126 [Vibrio crassostreae]|nr:hypothetical protein VCR20J5_280126 [Vibrio crassostreae]CDT54022.1 hypothetical protein VCR15J5_670129 [Vibrio crassostreae]CDT64395.1 hypothetical protein VCR9J2_790067 [Vibrio crassostreae]
MLRQSRLSSGRQRAERQRVQWQNVAPVSNGIKDLLIGFHLI